MKISIRKFSNFELPTEIESDRLGRFRRNFPRHRDLSRDSQKPKIPRSLLHVRASDRLGMSHWMDYHRLPSLEVRRSHQLVPVTAALAAHRSNQFKHLSDS